MAIDSPARLYKTIVLLVVAAGVAGAFYARAVRLSDSPPASVSVPALQTGLPRLVDLGAGKCVPCKMMAPILEEMKQTYQGRLVVEFIDVWKDPQAGKNFGIEMIPTQIFFDASGKELFRHEGFFSKEDMLSKWKALGVDLDSESGPTGIR